MKLNLPAAVLLGTFALACGRSGNAPSSDSEASELATKWRTLKPLQVDRMNHTATALPDGTVLVVGGVGFTSNPTGTGGLRLDTATTAEIYDPSPSTGGGRMTNGPLVRRNNHVATALADGSVLITGTGLSDPNADQAELFDPASETWQLVGSIGKRISHTATLLADGRVLVVGGAELKPPKTNYLTDARIFDPTVGTWTSVNPLPHGIALHCTVLLADGRVLVAGGFDGVSEQSAAYLLDAMTGMWTPVAPMLQGRVSPVATLLKNGRVLVMAGAVAQMYDPAANTWAFTSTPPTTGGSSYAGAYTLPGGAAVVTSTTNEAPSLRYHPRTDTWNVLPDLPDMGGTLQVTKTVLVGQTTLLQVGGMAIRDCTGGTCYDSLTAVSRLRFP